MKVEYKSSSHGCWVPTTITKVVEDTGDVGLDMRRIGLLDLREQQLKMRPLRVPSQAQLDWVRDVLRSEDSEGRLAQEARIIYGSVYRTQRLLTYGRGPDNLRAEDMQALAAAVDAKLGTSGSFTFLHGRVRMGADDGRSGARSGNCAMYSLGLSVDSFAEILWALLWDVHNEYGQAVDPSAITHHQGSPAADYDFVEGELGHGTFGVVRLATERRSRIQRAIKIVSRRDVFSSGPELDSELAHLRRCDHPHIVKLYKHYKDASNVYLIMDFCPGGELADFITKSRNAKRAIPHAFTTTLMKQVFRAIEHIHSHGILHLDLKPGNLLLLKKPSMDTSILSAEEPHVMVIDLGVAQLFRPGNFHNNRPTGTPSTMAPEVWRGELTPKADSFSCGVILYELLTLTLPFNSGADRCQAIQYWSARPSPPWHTMAKVPEKTAALCRQLLDLDRRHRPSASMALHAEFYTHEDSITLPPEICAGLLSTAKRGALQKSVAMSLARRWPVSRLSIIKEVFEHLDLGCKQTGRLDKDKVEQVLRSMGVDKKSASQAANAMDLSRDGSVGWTEWVAACLDLSSDAFDADLKQIFKEADIDGDGLLSQEDIARILGADGHFCGKDAVEDVFRELTGRIDQGSRLDWPTFQRHFQQGKCAGANAGCTIPSLAALGIALGIAPRTVGMAEDLLTEACVWLSDQAKEAFWPTQEDPGEPSEEALRQLAQMGFTDRKLCVEVLKHHRNNLDSRGLFEELLRKSTAP